MLRSNYLAILLIAVFVFASNASAQSCGCPQQKKSAEAEQRQKPYTITTPRDIAPRDLPVVYRKEAERAVNAANVVQDFPDKGFIEDAKAIAVIPGVKKAAFALGVRWGKGLMTRRDEDGHWLPPSFIQITGGNFGFQIGIQSTDLVLVFTNEEAINALLRGKLTLNADASAAAGPVGYKAQAGVPILINSGILSFISKSKGVFVGVSLDGAAITIDDSANANVYGKYISGDEILLARRVETNDVVAPFLDSLETRWGHGHARASDQHQHPADTSSTSVAAQE